MISNSTPSNSGVSKNPKTNALKIEKKLKDAPPPPLPFSHQILKNEDSAQKKKELERIAHKEGNLTVQEASLLLNDLTEKGKQIKEKLDELYRLRGLSPDYIRQYLSNPSNFSPAEWEALQKKRRELVDSLNLPPDLISKGDKYAPPNSSYPTDRSTQRQTTEGSKMKERRKPGGAQRRGWLPMR